MSKSTKIINHLEGATSEQIAIVGTSDQVQLIKKEEGKPNINEFYDTIEEAQEAAEVWVEG